MLQLDHKNNPKKERGKLKQALLNWVAAYLIVMLIYTGLGDFILRLPLIVRVLLLTFLLVFSMTYLVSPFIQKIFHKWLNNES